MFFGSPDAGSGGVFSATDPFDFNQHSQSRRTAWSQQAIRLGPGELGFCVHGVELSEGVYVDETWFSGWAGLEACAHPDSLMIGFFVGDGLRLQGAAIRSLHVCITPPGAKWDAAGRQGGRWQAVHLCGSALRDLLDGSTAAHIAALSQIAAGATITVTPTEAANSLLQALERVLRGVAADRNAPAGNAAASEQVKALARNVLREVLSGEARPLARSAQRRAQVARAAARLIWKNVEAGSAVPCVELDDVAQALGVSRRTVQLAFSEYYGVSFRTMHHAARLHRAHAMIRAQGQDLSVTQIATRCGFAHLGRFSRYYQRMFGRLPRETRSSAFGARNAA